MKFYSNLNLQQNELLQALLENIDLQLGTGNEVSGIKGQIAYNTADDLVYIHNGVEWFTIGSAAEIEVAGGTSVDVTNGTFTLNQMDGQTITVSHANITRSNTTSSTSPELGDEFTMVDSVTTDAQGHITAVNVKTVTVEHPDLPSAYATTADDATDLTGIEFLVELSVDSAGHVSAGEFRKLVAGLDLVATAGADGIVTFAHKTVTTTASAETAAPDFEQTFTAISALTIDNGHVTDIETKTVTIPTETDLSLVDNGSGSGTWLTGVSVDDHEITLTRSDSTTATITVGELIVSDATGSGDATIDGDLLVNGSTVIEGNLTVNGTTTSVNTQTLEVEDYLIEIGKGNTEPLASYAGFVIPNYDGTNAGGLIIDNDGEFRIGDVTYSGNTITNANNSQAVLTRDEIANLDANDFLVWDADNNRAIGKTAADLSIGRKVAIDLTADLSDNANEVVTHNLGTKDIQVTLYDVTGGQDPEIAYADFAATSANAITFYFGNLPVTNQFRAVIIG